MSENLGVKIKALRKKLNLTLEDFGKLVFNTSKSNVHKWENNVTRPSTKNLKRIAELANQSLEEFINDENTEISIFEANYLISENARLERELCSKKQDLFILNGALNSIYDNELKDEYGEEILVISNEISKQIDLLSNEITQTEKEIESLSDEMKKNSKKISEIQKSIFKTTLSSKIFQENLTPLETLFHSSYPLTINEKLLTAEDKKRALEILKLVFK